jgi:hypothetical protein
MTASHPAKVKWLADTKAGYAHAFTKPGILRALCGARTINERFGYWPILERCQSCSEKLGELF